MRNYLWYIIRHKWYVFLECCKLGIPLLGITHDWSKFTPKEFMGYYQWFYGDKKDKKIFDEAWLYHQRSNKHHWQWWILSGDDGEMKVLEMPKKYMLEMVADWKGAGRAQGKPDTIAWYIMNRDKMFLHRLTRGPVETALEYWI